MTTDYAPFPYPFANAFYRLKDAEYREITADGFDGREWRIVNHDAAHDGESFRVCVTGRRLASHAPTPDQLLRAIGNAIRDEVIRVLDAKGKLEPKDHRVEVGGFDLQGVGAPLPDA
jgi:hypothetical protein